MRFLGSAVTDIGISRERNQDGVCVKIAELADGSQIAMAVLCDGMGGLSKGELASATVIRRFSKWFETQFPTRLGKVTLEDISVEWDRMLKELNYYILDYGKKRQVNLGTTVSALLLIDGTYLIAHVGDSRIYEIKDQVTQLTEDQTFVERELKRGNLTLEEAQNHPKRNVLLQCVGASRTVTPQILTDRLTPGAIFLLCSDGFRHVITENEIFERFRPSVLDSADTMGRNSRYLIELVKSRGEKDNITVALVKCL